MLVGLLLLYCLGPLEAIAGRFPSILDLSYPVTGFLLR